MRPCLFRFPQRKRYSRAVLNLEHRVWQARHELDQRKSPHPRPWRYRAEALAAHLPRMRAEPWISKSPGGNEFYSCRRGFSSGTVLVADHLVAQEVSVLLERLFST